MKKLLILFFFGLLPFLSSGNPVEQFGQYRLIHDFSDSWLMYNHDEKVYVPYLKEAGKEFQTYTLAIVPSDFPKAYLVIKTPDKQANIFVNHGLKKITKKQEWLAYSLDELARENKQSPLYITFFTVADPTDVTAYIGFPSGQKKEITEKSESKEVMKLLPRNLAKFNSGIAMAFVIGLIVTSFLSNNYARVYAKFYSLRDVLSTKVKEDLFMIGKSLDRPNLLFVILLSLVVGYLVLLIQSSGLKLIENTYVFQSGNSFGVYIINFFKVSLLAFIVFVLKFFYLNLVSKLFNLAKITDLHYFKAIQCSLFFFSLCLLVTIVMHNLYIPLPDNLKNVLFLGLTIFFLWRGILIYFTINRESNVKFLYLFSYLCIAEALPVILGLRLVF